MKNLKNVKDVVVIAIVAVVLVITYIGLSMLQLNYDSPILDMIMNPGFAAMVTAICCIAANKGLKSEKSKN